MIRTRLFLAHAFLLLLSGCARPAPPAPLRQVSGATAVTLTSGAAVHTGDNTVIVAIMDAVTGAAVGDANITASPEMRAPTLPGVRTSGRAQGNGLYTIPIRLAVATKYLLVLQVQRPGHPAAEVSFPVEAS